MKKIKYLSYIEETPKHLGILKKIVRVSGRNAVEKSRQQDIPFAYLEDSKIIVEESNGQKNEIIKLNIEQRKVKLGTTIKLRKRTKT